MKKVILLAFLLLNVIFLSHPGKAYAAYVDTIALPQEEVWAASKDVLTLYGIHDLNEKKFSLQSNWIEDSVIRSRGLFRGILKQKYARRYRISVTIERHEQNLSEVRVKGRFQEKSAGRKKTIPWKDIRTKAKDHRIEREIFFKILTTIEKNKTSPPKTSISETI